MCGILGIIARRSGHLSVDDDAVTRMRDTMTHRGPDDAGLWRHQSAVLAHRRLSVIDVSSGGHQPMLTPDGRFALVYNGELYNDASLRRSLEERGTRFRSHSDTETVLHLLSTGGPGAMDQIRGMYALGLWDTQRGELLLARDPLGIKPLYYAIAATPTGPELVFASELPAILAHPHITARPDPVTVSGYLTTIRTTLGRRTLFEGVCCVRPGEVLRVTTDGGITVHTLRGPGSLGALGERDGPGRDTPLRELVVDSVRSHLRSDVPICCLLSGGLDSSIVASIAMREVGELHTFCAGAVSGPATESDDFAFARLMAGSLGSTHTESPISSEMFLERWCEMIGRMGVPLSTPNEVAINEVARTLRGAGKIVTLSGEGADELFGGYQLPMQQAADFEASLYGESRDDPSAAARARAMFQISSNAWMGRDAKAAALSPEFLRASERDAHLMEHYTELFGEIQAVLPHGGDRADAGVQAHLDFLRRVNLPGLLQRLDTASMLESVEGRTPLADVVLAGAARSLSMSRKFVPGGGVDQTKIALREAFAADLPGPIVHRPKASFPLPFQQWMGGATAALTSGALARALFTPEAIRRVSAQPERSWNLAWPMLNIAMWGERWWGERSCGERWCGAGVAGAGPDLTPRSAPR